LARGRALLKNRLERSGLGAALHAREPLGILTLDRAQSVVGSELVKTMARTAARLAGGQALSATVPVGLAQLVAGASPTMTVSRLTLTGSLLVFAGLAAWGVVALAAPSASGEPRAQAQPEAMLLAVAPMSPTPATVEDTSASTDEGKNSPEPSIPDDLPPVVVALEPKLGARDVDPGLKEIRVTFSKKMKDKSWSWTEGKAYAVPKPDGTIHYERDQRTCVMPVKLEPGKTYVLGVNSERFRGFKDADGRPALPYLLVFHTKTAR
jgi:RNA polymerase sigma-70 factor (ECF subfamily)